MKTHYLALAALAMSVIPSIAEPHQGVVSPIKQVSVNSPVLQEVITKFHVREGDTVKEGDVLVELRREREELDVKLSEKLIDLKKFIARGQQKLFKEEMGSEEKLVEGQIAAVHQYASRENTCQSNAQRSGAEIKLTNGKVPDRLPSGNPWRNQDVRKAEEIAQ